MAKTPRTSFNFRMPADLHAEATELSDAMGISLNAFCTLAVRNWVDYQAGKLSQRRRPVAASPVGLSPSAQAQPDRQAVPRAWLTFGKRNEPCPCGSGKKWKFCHGNPAS